MIYYILYFFKMSFYSIFYFFIFLICHILFFIFLKKNYKTKETIYSNLKLNNSKLNQIELIKYLNEFNLLKKTKYNLSFNEIYNLNLIEDPLLKINNYFFFKNGSFIPSEILEDNNFIKIPNLKTKEDIKNLNIEVLIKISNSIKEASYLDNFEFFYLSDGSILMLKIIIL